MPKKEKVQYDTGLVITTSMLVASFLILFSVFIKTCAKNNSPIQNISNTIGGSILQKDSLQFTYNKTINEIDKNILTDSLLRNDTASKSKFIELNNLRIEIANLLKDQAPNTDLNLAKIKIEELQLKVALLQNKYTGIASENKRLQALLNQLLANKTATKIASEKNLKQATDTKAYNNASLLANKTTLISSVKVQILSTDDNIEEETTSAENATKMKGSFFIKNIADNNEIMLVLTQPNGRVLKNSIWESGTFETSEGKKIYTRKLVVSQNNETQVLNFSITPDAFMKGSYTLQIWYNGNVIGKVVKALS